MHFREVSQRAGRAKPSWSGNSSVDSKPVLVVHWHLMTILPASQIDPHTIWIRFRKIIQRPVDSVYHFATEARPVVHFLESVMRVQ